MNRAMSWRRALFLASLAGCIEAETPGAPSCTSCHGSPESPSPPNALGGFTDPTYRGVGAHRSHVVAPDFSEAVACTECHRVPEAVDDEGHVDSLWPAEVGWTEAEIHPEASEPFDGDSLSCTVYCHGATLAGGSNTRPSWTVPFEGAVCDDCHGFPPPPPHPASEECSGCHPNPLEGSDVHIDGELQVNF